MRINADFSQPALVVPGDDAWTGSPESGVERLMLDRIGDEVARATSLVRYAAGSSFSRHVHAAGEEFLVLDGVFSDEHGDYPPGTYIRNPPGSSHSPYSKLGCRILVKLRQFDPADLEPVVIDTNDESRWSGDKLELHRYDGERVWMQDVPAGEHLPLPATPGGTEMLIVHGEAVFEGTRLSAESWLRLPADRSSELVANTDCRLWLKSGHLPAS